MNSKIKHNFWQKRRRGTKKKIIVWLSSLVLGTIPLMLISLSAKAADRISFNYGFLKLSISLNALENYAETGKVDEELKLYFLFISAENQKKLRQILNFELKINSMQLTQGLYSQMGENLLNYLGEIIKVDTENGAIAIRDALIKTSESEDLTPINLLNNFSGEIQFDIIKILSIKKEFISLIENTEKFLPTVKQMTLTAAANEPKINFSKLPDLRQPGKFYFSKNILEINDKNRNRQFIANLYLPSNYIENETIPVVILSPGLAAKLTQWQHLAEHLASYGFLVAKVQHPGSDFNHFQAFLDGKEKDIFELEEFINRPLDISYLLDELERLNKSEFQGKLNLKNVGIAGQSFGAYTALALAGAKINFEQLKQDCLPQIKYLNPSLFLQCRALELPEKNYNLRDQRITSVLVMDPVNRSIFGRSGLSQIKIPILWVAGSEDQLTPVAIEQVEPFTWLPVKEKYFMLTKGAKHLDFNIAEIQNVESVDNKSLDELVSASSPVIKSYINAIGLGFFQVYVSNNSEYFNYLSSSYALAISEEPYSLGFLSTLNLK